MDKVIILMATYQGERYLEEQLKSIVVQDSDLVRITLFIQGEQKKRPVR